MRGCLVIFFAFFPASGALRGGSLPKLMVGAVIGIAAWDALSRWARPRLGLSELLLMAFGLWYVLAVAASPWPTLAKETMVTVVGWTIVVFALAQLICNAGRVQAALVGYVVGSTIAGLWGIYNLASGAVPTVQIPGQDVNDTGFYTATGGVIAIGIWASRGVSPWMRRVCGVCGLVLALAVAGSLSRGSTAGLALGLAIIAFVNVYARWSLLKGAGLAAVLAVMTVPVWLPKFQSGAKVKGHVAGENVSSRLDAWGIGANLGLDHPLAGVGPQSIAPYILRAESIPPGAFVVHVAHNTVVEALYGTGVVGLALLGGGVYTAFRNARRNAHSSGGRAVIGGRAASPVLAALAAGLICSLFTTQLFNPTMWLVLALANAGSSPVLPRLRRSSTAREPAAVPR
ncbi:O-antigen ligase family protein [Arsenicicoccus piscis]|nr:O-antigen ligase family protein [Arsenicicoccus piscis]MCH8628054.1 O-antigen ligase family protein [Arsenicicoccus piscis]